MIFPCKAISTKLHDFHTLQNNGNDRLETEKESVLPDLVVFKL